MVDLDSRDRQRERVAARPSRPPDTRGSDQRGDFPPRRPAPPQHPRRHAADDPLGENRGLPPRDSPPSLPSPSPPSPRSAARDSRGEIQSATRPRQEAARAGAGDMGHRGAAATRRGVAEAAGHNAVIGAGRGGAREVAESLPARKEQERGEAGQKRCLGPARKQPALKRRAIPVDSRVPSDKWRDEAVPLRRSSNADGSRACAARDDVGYSACEKVAPRPPLVLVGAVPPRAVGTSASKKVSAADGGAQTVGGDHHGARSRGMKSSKASLRSPMPATDGLMGLHSQGVVDYTMQDRGKGTGELRKKELVQTTSLPSNPPMGFAKVIGKSNDKRKDKYGKLVTSNRIVGSDKVPTDRVIHASLFAYKHPTTHENGLATGPCKRPEIMVVPAMEIENLANTMAYNLENDDILSALAISKGKIILYIKNSTDLPSLRCQRQCGVQNEDARGKFKMICKRFQFICKALVQGVEKNFLNISRIDTLADEAMKKLPDYRKPDHVVGQVPGIEVGDEFIYAVQLAIVGLHRKIRAGIDWSGDKNGIPIATSIVSCGGYPDEMTCPGELIYTGSGGKLAGKKNDEDQKLKLGNLALKNCIGTKTLVRVIYGFKSHNVHGGSHSMGKMITTYIYDGLYRVKECKIDGVHGSKMFKFKLQKVLGQPELPLRAKGMMKSKMRRGLRTVDISNRKEDSAFCVDQEEGRVLEENTP